MKKNLKYIIIIILNILLIRAFIIEPFRIPSGSMMPTLIPGDFIFVNKFSYGIKIPIINKEIITVKKPSRGDVIVFKHTNKKKYIKRVIGIEGDNIKYKNKQLTVNGQLVKNKVLGNDIDFELGDLIFETIKLKEFMSPNKEYTIQKYENIDNNKHNYTDLKVPKNSYFVLGDNRDNSEDSRAWGFVNENDLLGQAFMIWFSFDFKDYIIRFERLIKKIK